jgi:hypothetical protein
VFRAACCRVVPVVTMARRWTDAQRLTWEEFAGGAACRGCGRGLLGGPEWKPVLQRTLDEVAAFEEEEAAFRVLHPDCGGPRWRYGSSGLTHCSECCPPPPLSPGQSAHIARILADIVLRSGAEEAARAARWKAAARATSGG